jgi:hypothetical protein
MFGIQQYLGEESSCRKQGSRAESRSRLGNDGMILRDLVNESFDLENGDWSDRYEKQM